MVYDLFEAVLLYHRVSLLGDTTFTYLQLTLLLQDGRCYLW